MVDKTSVWKTIVKIKKKFIIKNKYLDLSKIKNLYIHDISKLFKNLRGKLNKSQRECAKILRLNNVSNYENLNQAIPFKKLLELSNLANFNLYYYLEKNKHKFSCGKSIEIPTSLPLKIDEAIELSKKIKPSKLKTRYVLYLLENDNHLLDNFKIYLNKNKKKIIHSALLWNYLDTYFEYKKTSLIKFPLNKLYSDLKSEGVSDNVIISSLLITEGSKNKKGFDFSNKSKVLHDLLVESVYNKYKILPTTYFRYQEDASRTFFSTKEALNVRKDIENFIGNLKTTPRNDLFNYLREDQPSLSKVIKNNDKIALLRIFAVTEGGIYFKLTPYNRKNKEFIALPQIYIICTHPKILLELYNILLSLNFHPTLIKGKSWSNWTGIILPSFRDSIRFLELGGFLNGVKVARTDSKFYNIEKQSLFLAVLELRKMMLIDKELRKYNKKQLINEIFKIIKSKGYNSRLYAYSDMINKAHNQRELKTTRINDLKKDVDLLINEQKKFIKSKN